MLSPITFIPAMDATTSAMAFPDGSVVVTDIPRIWAIWSDGFCEWPAMAAMKSAEEGALSSPRHFFYWFMCFLCNKVTENDMLRACTAEKR